MHFQRNSLMQLKRWSRQGLIGLVLILCAPGCIPSNKAADLILTNAQVYTLNWQGPDGEGHPSSGAPVADGTWLTEATAIAIRNGMILGVGSESEMMIYSGTETLIRDMNGAFIVPGLIESHGHLHEIGEKAEQINLVGVESETDIADRLMEGSERPAGEWIIGSGWDEGNWANHLPTRGFLNEMFPDNPVVLKGLRGSPAKTAPVEMVLLSYSGAPGKLPPDGTTLNDTEGLVPYNEIIRFLTSNMSSRDISIRLSLSSNLSGLLLELF